MQHEVGRIARAFAGAEAEGRAALVVYTTAGFPTPDDGLEALIGLADAGADLIELGVPFSDPLADGPTIQRSSFEAIRRGVDLGWTLGLLRQFRAERETPVVLFSYLNPILRHGVDAFIRDAVEAGADGVLLTDLPLDADPALEGTFEQSPLDFVRLIAPTTSPERARAIAARSGGFVYYISRTGVTGARAELPPGLAEQAQALQEASDLPVAVGFGISTPEQAAATAAVADGVVVGSAVVEAFGRGGVAGAQELVAALRGALGRGAPVAAG